jgi:hypothetical protein
MTEDQSYSRGWITCLVMMLLLLLICIFISCTKRIYPYKCAYKYNYKQDVTYILPSGIVKCRKCTVTDDFIAVSSRKNLIYYYR